MSALIGALRASLSLETVQFEAGARRAQRVNNSLHSSFKRTFGSIGEMAKAGLAGLVSGLSVGLLVQGAKSALEYAGSLGEISQQLGVTTRDLQVFRYAAGQVGVEQATLETGLKKLTITMGQMAAGAKAPREALDAVRKGLADQVLAAKDTGQAFRIIADALQPVTDRAKRAAVEVAVLKKSGSDLDNLLAGGSKTIDDYAAALENMGGILSDEEIQSADLTADKIEQLNNQLKANIAGSIARNSSAILDLANSLIFLVSKIGKALTAWNDFKNALDAQAFDLASKNPFLSPAKRAEGAERAARARGKISDSGIGWNVGGSKVIIELPPVNKPKAATGGADIGQFLAGGGGGRSKRDKSDDAERKRQEALRNAFQFDQELLRAQMDVLRAQQQLATDYSERAAISIQLLNLDKQGFEREMEYAVASGELSKAQAAQLQAEFAKKDALERQAVLAEEETQRKEDYNRLEELDFDLQRDILESQEQLARTASEQRNIRLRLLDLDYRAERARLETILADEKASYAAKEEARRRLQNLNKTYSNDQQGVMNATAGPLEQWANSVPQTAAQISEALESIAANGLDRLSDGITNVLTGTQKLGDAFREVAQSIIADIIKMITKMMIMRALSSIFGGGMFGGGAGAGGAMVPMIAGNSVIGYMPASLGVGTGGGVVPGFASGGTGIFGGIAGVDRNVLSLNGLPIAKVSKGERFEVSNDNGGRGGGNHSLTQNFYGQVSRETALQAGVSARRGIAQANRKGG